ncbi:hypothetical protein JOQ06_012485, partial [Pogonophryne albipinna]
MAGRSFHVVQRQLVQLCCQASMECSQLLYPVGVDRIRTWCHPALNVWDSLLDVCRYDGYLFWGQGLYSGGK